MARDQSSSVASRIVTGVELAIVIGMIAWAVYIADCDTAYMQGTQNLGGVFPLETNWMLPAFASMVVVPLILLMLLLVQWKRRGRFARMSSLAGLAIASAAIPLGLHYYGDGEQQHARGVAVWAKEHLTHEQIAVWRNQISEAEKDELANLGPDVFLSPKLTPKDLTGLGSQYLWIYRDGTMLIGFGGGFHHWAIADETVTGAVRQHYGNKIWPAGAGMYVVELGPS